MIEDARVEKSEDILVVVREVFRIQSEIYSTKHDADNEYNLGNMEHYNALLVRGVALEQELRNITRGVYTKPFLDSLEKKQKELLLEKKLMKKALLAKKEELLLIEIAQELILSKVEGE